MHIRVIKIFALTLEGFTNTFLHQFVVWKIAKCISQWTEEAVIRGCQIRTMRDVLPYSPRIPDLAPSDYHFFGSLKDTFRGRYFPNDDKLKKSS